MTHLDMDLFMLVFFYMLLSYFLHVAKTTFNLPEYLNNQDEI